MWFTRYSETKTVTSCPCSLPPGKVGGSLLAINWNPGLERDASFVPSRGLSKVSLSFCPAAVGSDEKLGNILNPLKPLLARRWTMQWPVFGADCCKTFKRYMYDMSLRVVEILRKWNQTQVSLLEGKWQRVARARKININRAEEVPSVAKPVFLRQITLTLEEAMCMAAGSTRKISSSTSIESPETPQHARTCINHI